MTEDELRKSLMAIVERVGHSSDGVFAGLTDDDAVDTLLSLYREQTAGIKYNVDPLSGQAEFVKDLGYGSYQRLTFAPGATVALSYIIEQLSNPQSKDKTE